LPYRKARNGGVKYIWEPGLPAQLSREEENNYFSWKQEDEAVSYTFLLSRQQDLSDPLIEQHVRDNYCAVDVTAASLVPGQYYWGVYQTDMEGNNSASSPSRVLVVMAGSPPEQAVVSPGAKTTIRTAPRNLLPAMGYVLNEQTIIKDRKVNFSWDAAAGASGYIFTLYQITVNGNREILRQNLRGETSFSFTNLSLLDAGEFLWRVEPGNQSAGQQSDAAESRFTVDIGKVEASQGRESGVLFGNQ